MSLHFLTRPNGTLGTSLDGDSEGETEIRISLIYYYKLITWKLIIKHLIIFWATEYVYYWACVLLSMCTTEYVYYWVCVLLSTCTTEHVYYWVHVLLSTCTTEYVYYWACVLLSMCTTEYMYYWVRVLLSMCTTNYCWWIHLERELSFHSLQLQCTPLLIHHHFPPER